MNNRKSILLVIILANLICTLIGGHGFAPLGLIEYLTIAATFSGNFQDFPFLSHWTLSSYILLLGQILIIIGLFKNDKSITNKYGLVGIIFLTLALITLACSSNFSPSSSLKFFILTCAPFIILSIIFLGTIKNSHDAV